MLCLAAPPDLHADNSGPSGCLKPAVTLEFFGRAREAKAFSLALCDGTPNLAVLDEFSVHVRPRGARIPRPGATLRRNESEGFVARDIRRFDPRVLSRLQEVSERWPEKRIVVVSAYRPGARVGSRHHHAQAIDIRVEGVHRAEVAEFARALPETGVGFYSASTFTHIDVRVRPSFWVDQSEPGERSRYVAGDEEDAFFAAALAALPSRNAVATTSSTLPAVEDPEPAEAPAATAANTARVRDPALRREVRSVLEGLRGAFVVSPNEPSVTMRETPPTSPETVSAPPPNELLPTAPPPNVAEQPSEPAPIDWNAPW
ncbi:MAG: hypothetical protein ACI9KE_004081 [Polyangiales bacterium]|jgi:hypothetical protein